MAEEKGQEFREIGKKIRENPERMVLSRVPVQTQNRIKQIANEEFSGDYGMTLKSLVDLRELHMQSLARLDALEGEVGQLHRALTLSLGQESESSGVRKMLNGREIKVDKNE